VYTPQSRALSLDRSQIRRYHRRGLHVNGVHLDFGRVVVLHREPHLVRLRVVDRLSPMTALTRSGSPRSLPRDRPSRHLLVLRRTAVGWRIARVHAL
jgi:hypothetical protein